MKLQEDLITKADLTIESAEKLAVAKKSAKFSWAAMSGEGISRLKSSHQKNKVDAKWTASFCGGSKKHADMKDCPA